MSTEVVVHSSEEVASLDKLDEVLLTGELNVEVIDDPDAISRQIVAQLLSAKSDDELENFGSAVGWREMLEIPMELRGFRWQPSAFEEGAAIYFVVQAVRLDTGEAVVLTTGSLNVMAQLSNMARRGTLVGAVRQMVQAETPTRSGFRPLWLVTPEEVRAAERESAA